MRASGMLAAATLAWSLAARPAQAQTTASFIELPGGAAALARVLDLDPNTAVASRIFVEAARLAYSHPDGQGENVRSVTAVRQYFDAIEALKATGGIISPAAADPAGKRVLSSIAVALGSPIGAASPPPGATGDTLRRALESLGIDLEDAAERLKRGETVKVPIESGRVPIPLGADAWAQLLPRKLADRPLYRTILEDRHACLLYAGLSALDPETLAALGSIKSIGPDLYERAAAFAGASRGLRIRGGVLVPPGGAASAPLWEALVGESVKNPAGFIRRLYGGEGRLAYFFDSIALLDEPHQRYAYLVWTPRAGDPTERFRKLAEIFLNYDESWKIRQTPFSHPATDPALALHQIPVGEDGRPAAPFTRAFWTAALADPSSDASRAIPTTDDTPADAAWLIGRALEPPIAGRRARVERMLFVMRLARQGVTDQNALARASSGFARYPALMLTLERMHVTNPGLYDEAARHAAALDGVDDSQAATAYKLFQGALAIIERARFARSISSETATSLTQALVGVKVSGGGYDGALVSWLDRTLLPAIAGLASNGADPDVMLVRAVSGIAPPAPVNVTWEDLTYRVDLAQGEIARITRLRREQPLPSMTTVLTFARAVAATPDAEGPVPPPVQTSLAAIGNPDALPDVGDLHESARYALSAIADGRLRDRDRARLVHFADQLLGQAMLTFVYAISLGDADADPTSIFDAKLGDRHVFGRSGGAWTLPREESGSGVPWRMQGSLLGLDVGLSRFALRRLSTEPPMQAPRISSNDRQAFGESVALLNAHDVGDEDRDGIAAAIARGRERAAKTTVADVDAIDAVAHIGAWQREAIRWSLVHDAAAVPSLFSLRDYFWLGSPPAELVQRLDAWGLSSRPLDGGIETRFPRPGEWEIFSGRPSVGLLAARTPDMILRIALALTELKLPAALARGIAAAATLDLVDEAPLGHRDDRHAVAKFAEGVALSKIQDYVSLLTAAGPLIPASNRPAGAPNQR